LRVSQPRRMSAGVPFLFPARTFVHVEPVDAQRVIGVDGLAPEVRGIINLTTRR